MLVLTGSFFSPQPNVSVKPTPTSFTCGFPARFALRCGLPAALGFSLKTTGVLQCFNFAPTASAVTKIFPPNQQRLVSAPLNALSASLASKVHCKVAVPTVVENLLRAPGVRQQNLSTLRRQPNESLSQKAAAMLRNAYVVRHIRIGQNICTSRKGSSDMPRSSIQQPSKVCLRSSAVTSRTSLTLRASRHLQAPLVGSLRAAHSGAAYL